MSIIVSAPEPSLWEQICAEFAKQRLAVDEDDDGGSVATDYEDFNPARHNPVFYGRMFAKVATDADVYAEFDSALSHPSCIGYSFTSKPPKVDRHPAAIPPNRFICSPTEYLNYYIFPWLLPALEAMMKKAKIEKCFERRRTKFNACDFLTEYLYINNPLAGQQDRKDMQFFDIPFVKQWLKDHPRPPLPKSLIWTEEEAVVIIQSFWRGYLVRRLPEVKELREWQREWREENHGVVNRVSEFWDEQMPESDDSSVYTSEVTTETQLDDMCAYNQDSQ
ncbi:unnamed protein product [Candidula unifasciata]|uniref:IQ domain-containing protein K n=1 Tax=Candidula unifasciata TaxID=100452 RepID=A0A8S3YX18_9EUPU|nr:unnamed protein product [Candidula unifasciata]